MNKREFLKAAGAGAVVLTLPVTIGLSRSVEASVPLVSRLSGNGVSGSNILQGNEEVLMSYNIEIKVRLEDGGKLCCVDIGATGSDGILYRQGIMVDVDGNIDSFSKEVESYFNEWIERHPYINGRIPRGAIAKAIMRLPS